MRDMRQALRSLVQRKGASAFAIVTVAICVGVNAAMFTIADSTLFKPLPYPSADRLFVLQPTDTRSGAAFGTLTDQQLEAAKESRLFDAAMPLESASLVYFRDGAAVSTLQVQAVPLEYLSILGAQVAEGRSFVPSDGQNSVVLSFEAWAARFGRNPEAVGRTLATVDGPPVHIVGVLAKGFQCVGFGGLPQKPEALSLAAPTRGARLPSPVVRLRADVSTDAARAQLAALNTADLQPGRFELRLTSLAEVNSAPSRRTMQMLMGAALLVLLVGCLNLVYLIVARCRERSHEIAVRRALGASRFQLIRLLASEAALLCVVGGAGALAALQLCFQTLSNTLPPGIASAVDPTMGLRTWAWSAVLVACCGIATGVVPAVAASRSAIDELRAGRQGSVPKRIGRKAILALQVAATVVLIVAATALGHSVLRLVTRDLGFSTDGFLVRVQHLSGATTSKEARAHRFDEELQAVRMLSGIRNAAGTTALPLQGVTPDFKFVVADRAGGGWTISSGFFRTLGIPLREGREFTEAESISSAPVCILNASAAALWFPEGRPAIGQRLVVPGQPARTVVGVSVDTRRSLARPAIPAMYVPFDPSRFRVATMVVRADHDIDLSARISSAIAPVAGSAYVQVTPIHDVVDDEVSPRRFGALVVGLFGFVAVVLGGIGVYSLTTQIAVERRREYGIRLALGASDASILTLVFGEIASGCGAGVLGGAVVAIWTSRVLEASLFEVSRYDPLSLLGAPAVMLVCALLAAFGPALRAMRVDPAVSLRAE